MLSLYADESGIHADAQECVLAGYIASRRQWESFDREWQRAFEKLPAPIKEFHAKYFFPRGGDYRKHSVPEQQCREFLDRLLKVIENHNLHAFGVGVNIASFNSLTWGERAWLTGATLRHGTMHGGSPSSPYHICFMHAVIEAEGMAKHGKTIDFFFAHQERFMGLAAKHFKIITASLDEGKRKKIGTIHFPRAKEASAIQAADLLANCCYSWFVNKDAMSPEKRHAFQRCKKDLDFKGWMRETFEVYFGRILPPGDRERLRAMTPPAKQKK